MFEIKLCPECRAPEIFTSEHMWLNNGDIVQTRNPTSRLAFVECENLDPLFENIGEIIGVPIERMIIDIASRGLQSYLGRFIPKEVTSLLRSMKPGDAVLRERCRQLIDALNEANTTLSRTNGAGKIEVQSYRYERDKDDYSTIRVTDPYSLPFMIGSHAGHNGALIGGEREIICKEISPGFYELTSHAAAGDEELHERLKIREYHHREGDFELERCGSCGGPAALANYKWYLDRGIIKNTFTGRRMATLGPSLLDPIFEELEVELGDTIPRTVVEAQRRFVRTGFYSMDDVQDEGDMRHQFAVRGLGNLKEIQVGSKGMRARMDNVTLHLVVIGLMQGLFEMGFDIESHVDWELSGENDLSLEVMPRNLVKAVY